MAITLRGLTQQEIDKIIPQNTIIGYAYGQLHRMTHFDGDNRYKGGYMGAKRKALVDQYGYDVKNAAHCIRLLRMGIEYLNDGVLYVDRSKHDGPQLLEIKRGEWSLQQVEEEASRLFKRAELAYDNCKLPLEPPYEKINVMLVDMFKEMFVDNEEWCKNG